jgi:hypothetical protein
VHSYLEGFVCLALSSFKGGGLTLTVCWDHITQQDIEASFSMLSFCTPSSIMEWSVTSRREVEEGTELLLCA